MRHENLWLFASMLVLTFSVEVSAQPRVRVDVPVLTLQAAVTLAYGRTTVCSPSTKTSIGRTCR